MPWYPVMRNIDNSIRVCFCDQNVESRMFRGIIGMLTLFTVLTIGSATVARAEDDGIHDKGAEARVIKLVGFDTMKFDITRFEVTAGENIKVELKNAGSMPKAGMAHNFILLKKGTDSMAFALAAINARDHEYVPEGLKDQIIVATGLAGSDETVTATFTVPLEPGEYEYVCTFPGHYMVGMKGVMVVK